MIQEPSHEQETADVSFLGFLARVQRTDPAATEHAIRRFLVEVDEAAAALDELDPRDAALPAAYSAAWSRLEAR